MTDWYGYTLWIARDRRPDWDMARHALNAMEDYELEDISEDLGLGDEVDPDYVRDQILTAIDYFSTRIVATDADWRLEGFYLRYSNHDSWFIQELGHLQAVSSIADGDEPYDYDTWRHFCECPAVCQAAGFNLP